VFECKEKFKVRITGDIGAEASAEPWLPKKIEQRSGITSLCAFSLREGRSTETRADASRTL
jgi:hypothetical protein